MFFQVLTFLVSFFLLEIVQTFDALKVQIVFTKNAKIKGKDMKRCISDCVFIDVYDADL